jgi:hypothetical protein
MTATTTQVTGEPATPAGEDDKRFVLGVVACFGQTEVILTRAFATELGLLTTALAAGEEVDA